jgi:hypothetical protein
MTYFIFCQNTLTDDKHKAFYITPSISIEKWHDDNHLYICVLFLFFAVSISIWEYK